MKKLTPESCARELQQLCGNIVVLTHIHPDGDTLGSAAALVRILRALKKNAVAYVAESVPWRFRYLSREGVFTTELPLGGFTAVAVDVAAPSQLGDPMPVAPEHIAIGIDHHTGETPVAEQMLVMPDRSAAGEIIYELSELLGVAPDTGIAEALYTAIASDSGGFRFSSTSPRTHIIAAKLLEVGIDFAQINRQIFDTVSDDQFALERLAYSLLKREFDGKCAVLCFTRGALQRAGMEKPDYGDIAQLPRRLEGVEVGVTIRPDDSGGCRVSFRSNKYVNVSEIASVFGGGGHYFAAACRFCCEPEQALPQVLSEVGKRL